MRAQQTPLAQDVEGLNGAVLPLGRPRKQKAVDVGHLLLRLQLGRQLEVAHHVGAAAQAQVVQGQLVEQLALPGDQVAAATLQVVVVVAAHQVMLIAQGQAIGSAREQHQACVFVAAGGQHKGLGAHLPGAVPWAAQAGLADRSAVGRGRQCHGGGMGVDRDLGRIEQLLTVVVGEDLEGAELEHAGFQATALERQLPCALFFPGLRRVAKDAAAAHLLGAPVMVHQLRALDGPAAVGDPGPRLKVDLVKHGVAQALFSRPQAHAPDIGVAAELPAIDLDRGFDGANRGAIGQGLHLTVIVQAAAFQQGHPQPLAHELARQADASRAGANDAKVALQRLAGQRACVDVHDGSLVGQGRRRRCPARSIWRAHFWQPIARLWQRSRRSARIPAPGSGAV